MNQRNQIRQQLLIVEARIKEAEKLMQDSQSRALSSSLKSLCKVRTQLEAELEARHGRKHYEHS